MTKIVEADRKKPYKPRGPSPILGRPSNKGKSLEERFWQKVDKNGPEFSNLGPCWVWTGSHNQEGRGQIYVGGKRQVDEAHRVSWALHGHEVPDRWTTGNVIDHICKRIDCVNPAHLRVVSQTDNCTVLARPTPFYTNKLKTHCVHGHEFTPDNTALVPNRTKGRHGKSRTCLTCYPYRWKHAIIKRNGPPGLKKRAA